MLTKRFKGCCVAYFMAFVLVAGGFTATINISAANQEEALSFEKVHGNDAIYEYARDLTEAASHDSVGITVGIEAIAENMLDVLMHPGAKSNVVLLNGTHFEHDLSAKRLAQMITEMKAGNEHAGNLAVSQLKKTKVLQVNLAKIVANRKEEQARELLGKFFAKVNDLARKQPVFLYIDQKNHGTTEFSFINTFNFFSEHLLSHENRERVKFIFSAEDSEFEQAIKDNPAIKRSFETIKIAPPTTDEALFFLKEHADILSKTYGIQIPFEVLEFIVDTVSQQYSSRGELRTASLDMLHKAAIKAQARGIYRAPEVLQDLKEKKISLSLEIERLRASGGNKEELKKKQQELAKLKLEIEGQNRALQEQRKNFTRIQQLEAEIVRIQHRIEKANTEILDIEHETNQIKEETENEEFWKSALAQTPKEHHEEAKKLIQANIQQKLKEHQTKRTELDSEIHENEQKIEIFEGALRKERGLLHKDLQNTLTKDHVREIWKSEHKGVFSLSAEDRETFFSRENLFKLLSKRVIGQDHAKHDTIEAIRSIHTGMKYPNAPVAVMVFLGDPGVGKTELAKAIASEIYGSEDALVLLSMNDFQEHHEAAKLFGAPPGYVGYEEGGQLTEPLRENPMRVVLLDEILRAHTNVFDKLLKVLDDGEVTDNKGRKVSFRQSIIILTDNARSQEEFVRRLMLKGGNNAAFANRLQFFIPFEAMKPEVFFGIAGKYERQYGESLAEHSNPKFTIDDSAKTLFSNKVKGSARDLRVLMERILKPFVNAFLIEHQGKLRIKPGTTLQISAQDDKLVFKYESVETNTLETFGEPIEVPELIAPKVTDGQAIEQTEPIDVETLTQDLEKMSEAELKKTLLNLAKEKNISRDEVLSCAQHLEPTEDPSDKTEKVEEKENDENRTPPTQTGPQRE